MITAKEVGELIANAMKRNIGENFVHVEETEYEYIIRLSGYSHRRAVFTRECGEERCNIYAVVGDQESEVSTMKIWKMLKDISFFAGMVWNELSQY